MARLNWKERIQQHKESGNPVSVGDLNMIAGRIIRGLGFPFSRLEQLERALGIPYADDKNSFDRATEVLYTMARRTYGASNLFGALSPDNTAVHRLRVVELPRGLASVDDILPVLKASADKGVFDVACMRLKNTQDVKAVYIAPYTLDRCVPPFTVYDRHGVHDIIIQNLEDFVVGFGPYKFGGFND